MRDQLRRIGDSGAAATSSVVVQLEMGEEGGNNK